MTVTERYSITSEVGVSYYKAIYQYISARFETLTSGLLAEDHVSSPHTKVTDLIKFAHTIVKAAPIYLVEQLATNAASYNSLRGSGYSEMSMTLAGKSIFGKGGIKSVMLNHEFRATANALDAVVDESEEVVGRDNIQQSPTAEGLRTSKKSFFNKVKEAARENQNADMTPFGNTARRYQIHQDLYLDLARMKKRGIIETKYLHIIPEPQQGSLLTREQTAHLIIMGLDAETLLVDSLVPVNQNITYDSEARDAAFWAGVMGTLGDQWADILQDLCNDSENMFMTVLDNFPDSKEKTLSLLSPTIEDARRLLDQPGMQSKLMFLKLQVQTHQILKSTFPDIVETYGTLIAKSFREIPSQYRDVFLLIRLGSWDLVSLYQLSDFLLHRDRYEEKARHRINPLVDIVS